MDLSYFIIAGQKERLAQAVKSNRRLIMIRWYYTAALLLIVAAVVGFIGHLWQNALHYTIILGGVYILNALMLLATIKFKDHLVMQYVIMGLQLTTDLSVAISTIFIQGGLLARTTLLFATPVIAAGLMFTGKVVYVVAIGAGLSYGAALIGAEVVMRHPLDPSIYLVPVLTYPVILVAQARIANYLARVDMLEERNESYDAFFSMMAHQLKHPASAAGAIIDVINMTAGDELGADVKRKLGMLKGENEDLIRTINNLVEAAGGGKETFVEKLDLRDIVQTAAEKVAASALRPGDLELELGSRPLVVEGEKYRLGLLFVNVLDNAFRYSDDDSKVTVRLSGHDGRVLCEIIDRGKGIDEKQMPALFKRHDFSAHRRGASPVNGMSLGLYVARRIAEAHNGGITISSDKDETRAMIELKGRQS